MKTKKFHFGNKYFKTYCKTVGHGWEVGVTFEGKTLFVGNFIHNNEATSWWAKMNKEVRWFSRTHKVYTKSTYAFYGRYMTNHLYKCYYTFLDKAFTKYTRTYNTACTRDFRKYRTMKRTFGNYTKAA